MASVQAISNTTNPCIHSHIELNYAQPQEQIQAKPLPKWTYLLSNDIRFSHKPAYSICLPKPELKILANWIEKIITSGQCARLFVEQLSLDEVNFKRIKQLCLEHKVTLVNLLHQEDIQDNVIQGPW